MTKTTIESSSAWRDYWTLCKPRVVLLMLFTAWIGMYLASEGTLELSLWSLTTLGIAFLSSAAATVNHIVERRTDALMERTQGRPVATGRVVPQRAWIFAFILSVLGFVMLYYGVNHLTALLTLGTALGYALCYTLYLKPNTPQNIVLGGLFGAMPPLLGWTAVTGNIDAQPLLLVLIIFAWTPAHFWALSVYRYSDYERASIPMLPVTHGIAYTKLYIVLYSILTVLSSLLVFAIGLCGWFYLVAATLLGSGLLFFTLRLYFTDKPRLALLTFFYSMVYLFVLFLAMAGDRYLLLNVGELASSRTAGISSAATVFPEPRELKPFRLTTANGPFSQADLKQHWTLLFFGFTHCSDVCPTTLATLKELYQTLHPQLAELQIVFVSIDPQQDSPARLQAYVKNFNSDFIAATGTTEELHTLEQQVGIFVEDSSMVHTSSVLLINPQGKWAALLPYGMRATQIRLTLEQLRSS
jgi:protoheme IX farnesyltransferase